MSEEKYDKGLCWICYRMEHCRTFNKDRNKVVVDCGRYKSICTECIFHDKECLRKHCKFISRAVAEKEVDSARYWKEFNESHRRELVPRHLSKTGEAFEIVED